MQNHQQSESEINSSTPSFSEFSPDHIPYQRQVVDLIDSFDYSQGALEILLSGSVGSAKSLLAAHLGIRHCLSYPGARLMLGRKALPDLKDTIFNKVLEHLEGTELENGEQFKEGIHYRPIHNIAMIKFFNGSEVISRSWIDNKFKKLRSLELSAAIFEELTENEDEHMQAYIETTMRVGRLPHIKENWILSCTNPDSPAHWAYKRFMVDKKPRRKVFYSVTTDNPFLPKQYVQSLLEDLDPKLAQRMIYGQWIEISDENVYHQYSSEHNFINNPYEVNLTQPLGITFDFNIGLNKPLSSAVTQYIQSQDNFNIFGEVVIDGLRTLQNLETLADRGYLEYPVKYQIFGDASGRHKDTRNNKSDYDVIKQFFASYVQKTGKPIDFEMCVPVSNPPVRERHNVINAYCCNALKKRRLFVYKGAPTVDEGLRLTKLKKGAYIEDDSKRYQHITTAIGYNLSMIKLLNGRGQQGTRQL